MDKKQLVRLLASFVMGDGGVYYSGRECRYLRNQLAVHRDYLEFQQSVLSEVTETQLVPVTHQRPDQQPCLRLLTRAHPLFTTLRERFYTGNYKGIDPHYLKLLDWQTAAHLFMDDGSTTIDKRWKNSMGLRLDTNRLSYGDSLLLKQAFRDNLGVEFNVNRKANSWYLHLRTRDIATFLNNVRPFVFPSFHYKLTCPDGWLLKEDGDIVRTDARVSEAPRNAESNVTNLVPK